jgi:hypothetical protein
LKIRVYLRIIYIVNIRQKDYHEMDILKNITWHMQRYVYESWQIVPWYEEVVMFGDTDKKRPLMEQEWDIPVNEESDWVLMYDFNTEFFEGIDKKHLVGYINFRASATIKDVLGVIACLKYRCGWFVGLKHYSANKYVLVWD